MKRNNIILDNKVSMTKMKGKELELKLLFNLLTQITKEDKINNNYTYSLNLNYYSKITNTKLNYFRMKKIILNLLNMNFFIENNREIIGLNVFESVKIEKNTKIITSILTQSIKPYLLELKNNFTLLNIKNINSLKSSYSIKLYVFLKSKSNIINEYHVKLDQLKIILDIENKPMYNLFSKYKQLIEKSLKEINKKTDLNISYRFEKTSRKFTDIYFIIRKKQNKKYISLINNIDKEINFKKNINSYLNKKFIYKDENFIFKGIEIEKGKINLLIYNIDKEKEGKIKTNNIHLQTIYENYILNFFN